MGRCNNWSRMENFPMESKDGFGRMAWFGSLGSGFSPLERKIRWSVGKPQTAEAAAMETIMPLAAGSGS